MKDGRTQGKSSVVMGYLREMLNRGTIMKTT